MTGAPTTTRVAPRPAPEATPEQVRVGQGVGKSALVGRAGNGQHGPHQATQHHPGHAQLPHHDDPGGRKARVEMDQGEPAQDLGQDGTRR